MSRIKEWTKALRSGEYPQCVGTLHNESGYCCLGVETDLAIKAGMADGKWVGDEIVGSNYSFLRFGRDENLYESSSMPDTVAEYVGLIHTNPQITILFKDDSLIYTDPGGRYDYEFSDGKKAFDATERFSKLPGCKLPGFKQQISLAEMNDAGFTFEQIADVIDYFFEDGPVERIRPYQDGRIGAVTYTTLEAQAE